jgi:hypothetical protein
MTRTTPPPVSGFWSGYAPTNGNARISVIPRLNFHRDANNYAALDKFTDPQQTNFPKSVGISATAEIFTVRLSMASRMASKSRLSLPR